MFIRKMISLVVDNIEEPAKVREILFGTEIRTRHASNFETTFGQLLVEARAIDTDNMIGDALLYGSAAGIYYTILRRVKAPDDAWNMSDILTPRAPKHG